jgi:hypothetical protein
MLIVLWAKWCNETFSITSYMYLTFSNGNTISTFLFPLLGEYYFGTISFEVMLSFACSFIVDGLTFGCCCSTLHVSAYMAIEQYSAAGC